MEIYSVKSYSKSLNLCFYYDSIPSIQYIGSKCKLLCKLSNVRVTSSPPIVPTRVLSYVSCPITVPPKNVQIRVPNYAIVSVRMSP